MSSLRLVTSFQPLKAAGAPSDLSAPEVKQNVDRPELDLQSFKIEDCPLPVLVDLKIPQRFYGNREKSI